MTNILDERFMAAVEDAMRRPLDPKVPNRGALAAPNFSPTPASIGATKYWNAFENDETETSAYWLVKMAMEHGDWRPFTQEDINRVYQRKFAKSSFTFNALLGRIQGFDRPGERYLWGGGWIVEQDGKFFFTEEFVLRCYLSLHDRNRLARDYPWERERDMREYY